MQKTFIGPHLRRLRVERKETQGAMARALGISASYVNLLENNERSVSVQVLLRLFEAYGVDWRDIAAEDATIKLADLRAMINDPIFTSPISAGQTPDLPQLRAALVHAPGLVQSFMALYRSYQGLSDQLFALADTWYLLGHRAFNCGVRVVHFVSSGSSTPVSKSSPASTPMKPTIPAPARAIACNRYSSSLRRLPLTVTATGRLPRLVRCQQAVTGGSSCVC